MRNNLKLLIGLMFCSLSDKIYCQDKSAFTLQEAVEFALKNNPTYLNSLLEEKNAVYKKNEITGMGLPQVTGSFDLKNYIEIPTSLIPGEFFGAPAGSFIPVKFGTKYNATAGFNASQLIFSSDYIFGVVAAKEFINLSKLNTSRNKSEITAQVSKAYYNVIINKERLKLLDANVKRLEKMLSDVKAMNQQGFVELIDVERLEVQYNNLQTEKEKIEKLIELTYYMLKFQMGYSLEQQITLTDSLELNDSESISDISIKDISNRPDYKLLETRQHLLDIDLKRQKFTYLPTLVGYGAYQYNAQRQDFDFLDSDKKWFKIALVGGTINMNIFTGFQRHFKIQQAKIASQTNQNNLRNLELGAQLELTNASIQYENSNKTLKNQEKNMALAKHIHEVALKKYEQGIGSNLELINAETTLKEAETNYYNAIYDVLVSKTDYLKASGKLVK
ncbi:MAG: TolC family protein [Bacteroidia bacterium]